MFPLKKKNSKVNVSLKKNKVKNWWLHEKSSIEIIKERHVTSDLR